MSTAQGMQPKAHQGDICTNDWRHRFSFPKTEGAGVVVDAGMNSQEGDAKGNAVEMGGVQRLRQRTPVG